MRHRSRTATLAAAAATAISSLAFAPAVASAGPRRSGLYGGGDLGGEAVIADERTGGGFGFVGHLGYLAGIDARIGFEGSIMGGESWVAGTRRIDAVILGGLRLWAHDRVSLSLGFGLVAVDNAGSDQLVGGGAAVGASLGLDLRRWRKRALWLRATGYGGTFEDTRAIHLGLTLGLEWYGLTSPTPGP